MWAALQVTGRTGLREMRSEEVSSRRIGSSAAPQGGLRCRSVDQARRDAGNTLPYRGATEQLLAVSGRKSLNC